MRVADILQQKGNEVATVAPDQTVARAVGLLRERSFGALVVSSDGETIEGIISERDIVRALGLRPDLLDVPVSEIMTSEVVTCAPDDRSGDLMVLMTEHRIRHLPVAVGGRLSGLVSIGDVVKRRVEELERETREMHDFIQHGR